MKKQVTYAVVDLETTSTQNKTGRIIQIAVAFVQDKKVVNQFSTLINPGVQIPTAIEKLTHIEDRMVKSAPYFEDVAQMLHAMLVDTVFVAHNVNFDLPFLNAEFQRVGLSELTNQAIDTVTLSQILWPTASSYRLSDLTQLLHIEHSNPHRADSDAVATGMLLIAAIDKAASLPMITLQSLVELPLVLPRETKQIFDLALEINRANPLPLAKNLVVVDRLAIRRFSAPSKHKRPATTHYPKKQIEKENLYPKELSYRADQAKMMNMIFDHYIDRDEVHTPGDDALIIEAPTGMGKTLGYLMPFAYLATMTNKQVVITVPTIALQHQVVKTINQQLKSVVPFDIRGAQLKGTRNYLNLQSFKRLLLRDEGSIAMQFAKAQILVWLTETLTGDFDELNLNNIGPEFMAQLSQTANNPEASKFYQYEFEKRQHIVAKDATFLVVNHAYLTQAMHLWIDAVNKPYLVIDEAQSLPDVVVNQSRHQLAFSSWLSRVQMAKELLDSHVQPSIRGVFERIIGGQNLRQTFDQQLTELERVLPEFQQAIYRRFVMNYHTPATAGRTEHQIDIQALARFFVDHQDVMLTIKKHLKLLDQVEQDMMAKFVASQDVFSLNERQSLADFRRMLSSIVENGRILFQFQDDLINYPDATVFWITDNHGQNNLSLQLAGGLLHTQDYFKKLIYPNFMPPFITGATLFTTTKSRYLYTRLNLNHDTAVSEKFKEVYDYKRQSALFMVNDAPLPSDEEFVRYLSEQLLIIMNDVNRNTLVLFTSNEMLQRVYHTIVNDTRYRKSETTVLAQGISGTRSKLLKRMQSETHVMILGAMSFWEGVDLPGSALELVVLARLPFDQPNTVLQQAEDALLKNTGQSIFHQSILPKAILKLRQGIGRLIRSENDRGVIVIFDKRIIQKQYGKTMRNMLPQDMPQLEIETSALQAQLAQFFSITANNQNNELN
ncbi:DEAD/DEAH box helicase [Weissella diestrammenae]|uniref:3'-5' exonuclease DinG n=1 Tax=Weissella diestrammenae TaxID=1162633 RepID=A0A7G9T7P3_9LACO|nr:DEAD/DEAH box helicase [Weissella diestrammenae]QNN76118.1 DEAD/DEAH box helicase [Weissella diestrammenae]